MSADSTLLRNAIASLGTGHLVVVTGAGISLASGIPTFRGTDPDAVWKKDVTELGTRRYFESDPVGSWRWYTSRFDVVHGKLPNPGHRALVELEQWHVQRGGEFTLVTQNIDTLHEDAGSDRLVKVHGSSDRVRCPRYGCEYGAPNGSLKRADVDVAGCTQAESLESLPRCPSCESILRQHVLWFDEYYDEHADYQWQRVLAASETADCVIFAGTSFAVGVTDLFLRAAVQRSIRTFAIDPGASPAPHQSVEMIRDGAEHVLPSVLNSLRISG